MLFIAIKKNEKKKNRVFVVYKSRKNWYNKIIMRIVTNKELSNYKVLPFDLYTENKGKILEAGEVLTPGKLIMLKNYVKLYTEDFHPSEKEDVDSKEVDDENEQQYSSKLVNFSYDSLDSTDFETVINKDAYVKMETQVKIKYFYRKILDLLLQGYYEEGLLKLNSLISIIKTEVYKQVSKSSKGSKIRFLGEYELCHPLNVAIISGLIAQKLEFTPLAIDQVILSALLHDVGKMKIDLTDSTAMLTMNEEEVKQHTVIGYRLIKDSFDLPEEIAKVALEHHENNDGSGYPQGLSSDYISEYSQIVNVANYYDNLAFNRLHTQVNNNKEALRAMLEIGSKRFSAKMLYTFINMFNYDDSKSFNEMAI